MVDQFLVGHFEHHFNGIILNRIPLIKKLKLRSVMTFRGVIGNISDRIEASIDLQLFIMLPKSFTMNMDLVLKTLVSET